MHGLTVLVIANLEQGMVLCSKSRCYMKYHSEPSSLLGHGHLEFKVVTSEKVDDLSPLKAVCHQLALA